MILIMTHDEKFAHGVERSLKLKGEPVEVMTSGRAGLDRVAQSPPAVIVLDLYLKEPSGVDVLHELREMGYQGKIILLAGLSVSPLVPEALSFGVERVLTEPFALGPLECAIRSALCSDEHEFKEEHETKEDTSPSPFPSGKIS